MKRLIPLLSLLIVPPAFAEEQSAWQQQKCALYADAWSRALETVGPDDINYNFLASNENFIASGCMESAGICPRSNRERDIADLLTMVLMNEGAASTFAPFRC